MKRTAPGPRWKAVRALNEVMTQLDAAFDELATIRPRQARRWRTRSRGYFTKLAEPGKANAETLWQLVADLRALLIECREVADDELDPER